MIDPRAKYRDESVPNLRSVTMAELRHWLGVDPRRWGAAAAQAYESSQEDLSTLLEGWFAAAMEAGAMSTKRQIATTIKEVDQ